MTERHERADNLQRGGIARRVAFGAVAVVATAVALALFLWAAFPYFVAESGSARYAREHRVEAFVQILAGVALLALAWWCARRAMRRRVWLSLLVVLALAATLVPWRPESGPPEGVRHVGGPWHVTTTARPAQIDTLMHHLYYKRGDEYVSIEGQVAEYRVVEPDCIVYRGLIVVDRPMFAMCGYRIPVTTADTTTTEAALLERAARQPEYRADWRYNP